MPFAHAAPRRLDPALQDNARVLAIGVSRYDAWPEQPVLSATNNALSWMLQALRMGVSPYANPLVVEEATDAAALRDRLDDLLEIADLSASERTGLKSLLGEVDPSHDQNQKRTPPTLQGILWQLLFLGNHLEYSPRCRLLVAFSGHGALSQGRLVLCPRDTRPAGKAETKAELDARFEGLTNTLRSRGEAPIYGQAIELLETMFRQARSRGVRSEFLDVMAPAVEAMGTHYRPEPILALMKYVQGNLRRLGRQRLPGRPSFRNVLNPVHFILALGRHARRTTLVLDACHSGGPGTVLQGSLSAHSWIEAGLDARILSASQAGQLAAEARIGERRFSAATWALTQVLSRWEPVQDGPAYAMGIRNGELVLRANMLLQALSFNQQMALAAPAPRRDRPSAADLPFCGLSSRTRTSCEPQAEAGDIQLGSGTDDITGWVVEKAGVLKGLLLAVGNDCPPTPVNGTTYHPNKLYIFSTPTDIADLAGQPFTLRMFSWLPGNPVPPPVNGALNNYGNNPSVHCDAVGDPGEVPFAGEPVDGVCSYQKPGAKKVYLRWAVLEGVPCLQFLTTAAFPYLPPDFSGGVMAFNPVPNPGGVQFTEEHLIRV